MVRTLNHHHLEEEEDEEDFISRTTDGSSRKDGRRNDQKATSHRSKHSETEQRRRSKINERFQILRDLIPQNDQKRDRASFLLEVIQYIQFLQEKLQVYEGAYQGWSPEPTKLMPWRGNCGADQSPPMKNGSTDEVNVVFTPAMLTNTHTLVESDLNGSAAFKAVDHVAPRMDVPLQQNTFEADPTQSFPDVDLLTSQSRTQPWNVRCYLSENALQNCIPSEMEELKMQKEEATISNAYSKGLLNNLTNALSSCGVDLSQASISVQFDIRKGATSTSFGIKDHDSGNTHCGINDQVHKRPRTE